jgi:hypothetical protein
MALFAFVHYTPKLLKVTIQKPTSKSIRRQLTSSSGNLVIVSSGSTVERMPVSEAIYKLQRNAITDFVAVAQDLQLLEDDIIYTHGMRLQYLILPLFI